MSMSYEDLENEFTNILDSAGTLIPPESLSEARHYITHDEFELALDTIAATIAAPGKRVDANAYRKFLKFGNEMRMDEDFWDSIRPE